MLQLNIECHASKVRAIEKGRAPLSILQWKLNFECDEADFGVSILESANLVGMA